MKFACIRGIIEQNCIGFLPIPTSTARFLEVGFEGIRAVHVDNHTHVRLVYAHSECVCCYHYAYFITLPLLLTDIFREMFQACMIISCLDIVLVEQLRNLLCTLTATHINNGTALDNIENVH